MNYQEFLESKKKIKETDGIDIELDDLILFYSIIKKLLLKKHSKRKDLHFLKHVEWEKHCSN